MNNDEDDDEVHHNPFNQINALKSLLLIMQPNETVLRAIKRLGTFGIR